MSPLPIEHLQRLRAGDEGAAADLCRHFLPAVRSLALAGTLDPEAAEEVVKTTLAGLLERVATIEDPKRLLPVLEEITREAMKEQLRESGGRYTQLAGLPADVAARAKPPEPDLPGIFGDLAEERAAWMLLEAASFIPAHQEVFFLLRYLEGMDYEGISELTGSTREEVETALRAARKLYERELVFNLRKLAAS